MTFIKNIFCVRPFIKNILICFLILWYYCSLLDIFVNSCSNSWIKDDLKVNHYTTIESFTQSSEDMEEDMEETFNAEAFYYMSLFLSNVEESLMLHIIMGMLLIIKCF